MIPAIDGMLQRWALEFHGPDGMGQSSASLLGKLMDGHGLIVRSTARLNGGVSADIELIYNKRLPHHMRQLATVHYVDPLRGRDKSNVEPLPWDKVGLSRRTYYRRLAILHTAVMDHLMNRGVVK